VVVRLFGVRARVRLEQGSLFICLFYPLFG